MYKSEHIITLRHYLILSVIAFTIGIIFATSAGQQLLSAATKYLISVIITSIILLFVSKILFGRSPFPKKSFLLPAFLSVFTLLGIFRIVGESYISPNPLDALASREAWLTGTVITQPESTENGYSCYFQMRVAQINDKDINPEKIMIFAPRERGMKLKKGDKICTWTKINQQEQKSEGWPYNYEMNLRGKGIFHSGSIKNANPVSFQESASIISKITAFGEAASEKVVFAVDNIPIADKTDANILKGILVGDKTDFSDHLYQSFSYAGLSHIVAVSGMHLSILYAAITLLLSSLKIRKRLSLLLTVPVVILFASTASFTPSVCRAGIMILVMLTAAISGQRYTPINALFLSLGIILCVSPYSVYSQSLTLSFGATLGILVYYKYISYFLQKLTAFGECRFKTVNLFVGKVLNIIISSLSVSVSVTITTVYFSLLFFGSVSWIQLLTNIWVIPAVTAVFCLGYLACIFYYIFPPVAALISYPLNLFLEVISSTSEFFGRAEFTILLTNHSFPWTYFVAYVGLAILLYLILKTAYDLSKESEYIAAAHSSSYVEPKIPKL